MEPIFVKPPKRENPPIHEKQKQYGGISTRNVKYFCGLNPLIFNVKFCWKTISEETSVVLEVTATRAAQDTIQKTAWRS